MIKIDNPFFTGSPNIKTVNNQSLIGYGNIDLGGSTSSTIEKLTGEERTSYVSSIDIAINLDNYAEIIIIANKIQNNTNNIIFLATFLDQLKNTMPFNFRWAGYSSAQDSSAAAEYNSSASYFIASSQRLSYTGINNMSSHTITLKKQDTNSYEINSEYTFTDTSNRVIGGYTKTQGINTAPSSAQTLSYLRLYANTGLIQGIMYAYGRQKTTTLLERTSTLKPLTALSAIIPQQPLQPLLVMDYS